MGKAVLAVAALFLFFQPSPPNIASQETADAHRLVIDRGLVRVDVLVLENNKPVIGLAKENFVIYEDGVEQKSEYMSGDPTPLSIVIAVDQSGSLNRHFKEVKRVAGLIPVLDALAPEDEIAVIGFDHRLNMLVDFTFNKEKAAMALSQMTAENGGTDIVEAVRYAAEMLRKRHPSRRRAIILISDNLHGGAIPAETKAALKSMLSDNEIVVYNIKVGWAIENIDIAPPFSGEEFVRSIVQIGGQMIDARRGNLLQALRIASERLRYAYSLYYKPSDQEKVGLRKVRVELKENPRPLGIPVPFTNKKIPVSPKKYKVIANKEYYLKKNSAQ